MTSDVSFQDEIERLQRRLETARQELAELERQRARYDLRTEETREALERLRAAASGELTPGADAEIEPVEVNPDSGRPPRGARKAQIVDICRRLGGPEASFRTADVLRVMREVEGDLTDGMRSYTYAVMATLEEENLVEKIGRGTWKLT